MKLNITNHKWKFVGEKKDVFQNLTENWCLSELIDNTKHNKLITFPR
jgi:hypothetical protein